MLALMSLLVACGELSTTASSAHLTATFETWVCHVPVESSSPWFEGLPVRREVTPEQVDVLFSTRLDAYFNEVSGGRWRPVLTPGGELTISAAEGAEECAARAVEAAAADADGVIVVADAEHVGGRPGGLGGRAVGSHGHEVAYAYVGASEIAPSWGGDPPADLIEHEIGHSLGWVHSGSTSDAYDSALDVMSDSAAPRAADPTRRQAPPPLAVHLAASGWLDADEVRVVDDGGSISTVLVPHLQSGRHRLVVLPVGDDAVITIEYRTPRGLDAHLPHAGLALHLVEFRPAGGTTGRGSGSIAGHDLADIVAIVPLTGNAPFTDLLRSGDSLDAQGWRITADAGGVVTVGLVSAP